MRPRIIIVAAVLVVLALFVALNWALITTPAQLHLVVAKVEAPLGVVLLGFFGVLTLVYITVLAKAETSALLESRRQFKELDKIRRRLEGKELGEFNELKNWLEMEFAALHEALDSDREPGAAPTEFGSRAGLDG